MDDYFIQLNFKSFNVLICYLPNKQLIQRFYLIKPYINNSTILMGDFNLDYEAPRSAEEFELVKG